MKQITELLQRDGIKITAIMDAKSPEYAAEWTLSDANDYAQKGKSLVITSKKPLKVLSAVTWEKPIFKVIPGNKVYSVKVFGKCIDVSEFTVDGVASVKSAYTKAIKMYNWQGQSLVMFLNEQGQAPKKPKASTEIRLTLEQREKFEELVASVERFKNCYFWGGGGNSSQRARKDEYYSIPEYTTIINGDTYSIKFVADYHYRYVKATAYVYKNRVRTTVTAIKTLLEKDLNNPKIQEMQAI